MLVKTRHDDNSVHPLATAAGLPTGVEVLTLADLRSSTDAALLARPLRSDKHHLLTLTSGSLRHAVDFTEYGLRSGNWLWARPGQVQQWGGLEGAEGTLVIFEGGFLDPDTAIGAGSEDPHAPVMRVPDAEEHPILRVAASQLQWEFGATESLPLGIRLQILRHLLAVLVLRVACLPDPSGPVREPGEVYAAFRDAVERDFANSRRLNDYAAALAYSPRTLSRATLAASGVGAKEFIDRRVVLEAKRMLACSDEAAARIGARLGFSSATNFNKFFHQRTGTTPIAFRTAVRGPVAQRKDES
ncbi:helix-turn-helix domain-containing protein [Glycomyces arizonensis]|uniref:helix-turn-helix domain-containing protein n=1 Tax=Glycomyces arizonensis TaxID=256035 RepID=UPI00042A3B6B|nr:helix-turn-helix domain-containing protein [Glycomyces arizonensis]